MRRVIIPINLKLNAFILALLSLSIAFYVYYAVNLFESDKMAYVFESIKSQNQAVSGLLSGKIEKGTLIVESLSRVRYSGTALQEMFDSAENLEAFIEVKQGKIIRSINDKNWSKTQLDSLLDQAQLSLKEHKVFYSQLKDRNILGLAVELRETLFIGIFNYNFFTEGLKKSRLFHYAMMDLASKNWITGGNLFSQNLYTVVEAQIKKMAVDDGTFVLPLNSEDWIVAYDTLPKSSLILLTLVEEKKALEASSMLKHKSIFFGTFVLSLAILMGFLFSKIFTIPIKKLYEGSRSFVSQNFGTRVKISSWDELGVLADSFNTMADDIEKYMAEMEEKSRLENELKTAQLVQNSFFEGNKLEKGHYKLYSFYKPASECGGDWWGSIEKDGKLIVIVVDATGHGTAAALITAVIHNCQTALEYLMKMDPNYLSSSAYIMDYLNQSVCNVKSNLMATAFVSVLDRTNGTLTYTNASHNPPLLLKGRAQTMSKGDIVPMMDKIGKRLGEDSTATYEQVELTIDQNQRLLFYTDGLVEGENDQGKQWGKRKLINIILDEQTQGTEHVVENIINNAYAFFGDVPQADDICIVGVEMS